MTFIFNDLYLPNTFYTNVNSEKLPHSSSSQEMDIYFDSLKQMKSKKALLLYEWLSSFTFDWSPVRKYRFFPLYFIFCY